MLDLRYLETDGTASGQYVVASRAARARSSRNRGVARRRSATRPCILSLPADPAVPIAPPGRYGAPERWDGLCYFKSSDGHAGHWRFSETRLNLHVAAAAAECAQQDDGGGGGGGVMLVDSTRHGKRFPDSFSTTVPIWCARRRRRSSEHGERETETPPPAPARRHPSDGRV